MNIEEAIARFPKRKPDSHKGDYGHVLVMAGSFGYTGAAYLASQAAALSGAGLVTLAVGKSIYPILATKLTEVMVKPFYETKDSSLSLLAEREIIAFIERCSSIVMGPGISQNKETHHLVRNIVGKTEKPVVIDADAIAAFCGNTETLRRSKASCILTPHPGEMAKLTGKTVDEVQADRKHIASQYANEYNTVLILKGHETVVADPSGDMYVNGTGNPGMATGGSGDVLSGMIAAFIGQGCDRFTASVLGVYLHGIAGDHAAAEKGQLGMLAGDILASIPEALKKLA